MKVAVIRKCSNTYGHAQVYKAPTRNSELSTTTLILYTVFLPFNKEEADVWYPVRVWDRCCATACSKCIYQFEGKG